MFQRATVVLGILFVAGVVQVSAQTDNTHKGFWLSFGGGGGWIGSERNATTYFRMGGTPNEHVLFGGQVLHRWQDEDIQHSTVTAMFSVYPLYSSSRSRSFMRELFVKAGFGVATAHIHDDDQAGVGLNLGTGFDLRMGRNFFVTPNIDYCIDLFEDTTYTSLLFSLGLSWH